MCVYTLYGYMFLCTYKNVRIRRITHSKEIDWQLLSETEGWKGGREKMGNLPLQLSYLIQRIYIFNY